MLLQALVETEWAYVKGHSEVGERTVAAAPALAEVAKLVRSIHERLDGMGYPDGLAGEEIPLGAGTRFDPEVVRAFCLARAEIESLVA